MNAHDHPPLEPVIRDFLARNLLYSPDGFNYSDQTSFLQEGIIDSLGVMELVEFVSKQFGIKVKQREVTPDNFDSVANLVAFVRAKQKAGQRERAFVPGETMT
jgi:acyl carrier protein